MLTNAVLRIALMCAVWCGGYSLALAATVTIYDDSLGTLPGAQPWLAYGGTGAASQSVIPTGAQLTTDHNARAGYTNFLQFPSLPALDRSAGFSLDFELQILSEDHGTDNDRAGFSVIVLSSDNLGIEIAFWEDKIWAQSGPGFTHAEEMSYTTTGGETAYSLQILNSGYSLLANGSPILSDALRDYSPFGELPYVLVVS